MNPERPERTRTRRTASRSTRRKRETFPGEGTASSSANARLVSRRRRSLSSSSRNSPSTPSMPRVPRRVPRRADHPSLSSRSSRSAFDASPVPRRVAGSSVLAPRASRRRTPRRRSKDAHLCRPRATRSARNRHPRTRGERKGAWARETASRRPRQRPRQRPPSPPSSRDSPDKPQSLGVRNGRYVSGSPRITRAASARNVAYIGSAPSRAFASNRPPFKNACVGTRVSS